VDTAAAHDDVYAAVAVHPNEVVNASSNAWDGIKALASHPKVVAVGETGLDRFRTGEDGWAAQEESFRRHIAIAKETGKALVIHDRDAHDDVLRILAEEGPPEKVVFHCYSGDREMAKVCADHGYYMSFAGNVTFKNAADLREAAAVAPLDLLLVETDAPYLTPQAHRKERNQPAYVVHTARFVAERKRIAYEELEAAVEANAAKLFGW
jgi:TatD DNase family protein